MDKKMTIISRCDKKTEITIKNIEDVESIHVNLLFGDEFVTITYKNGKKAMYDSNPRRSIYNSWGEYYLDLDKIDEFSSIDSSLSKLFKYAGYDSYKSFFNCDDRFCDRILNVLDEN